MDTQIITPVNLPERVCKKRNRDAGLVCVIINDGCFTGGFLDVTDATDATGVITEVELHDNFMIDLKHQISIVQGDDMPTSFYTNFYMRTKGFKDLRNEDPFCKVLIINDLNNGEEHSEREIHLAPEL
jgi:hypothetical protein